MTNRFIVELECENEAFVGGVSAEVARILRNIADRIEDVPLDGRAVPIGTARDLNGNRVGSFRFDDI